MCSLRRGAIPVDIDIQFCGDPNAMNCRKKGVVPVKIFGNGVDVAGIDVGTLRLCLASDASTCTASGPNAWSIADRGNPETDLGADMCAVVEGGRAGLLDAGTVSTTWTSVSTHKR